MDRAFLILLVASSLILPAANIGLSSYLVPAQVLALLPKGDEATWLTAVAVIGPLVGVFTYPLLGTLCDRTYEATGSRTSWIIGGTVITIGVFQLMALTSNMAILIILFAIAGVTNAASFLAIRASIPDRVPEAQQGVASGIIGACGAFGTVIAAIVVGELIKEPSNGYQALCAGMLLLIVVGYLVPRPPRPASDARARRAEKPPVRIMSLERFRDREFTLIWLNRALLIGGSSMAIGAIIFLFLSNVVLVQKEGAPPVDIKSAVATASICMFVALLLATLPSGWLSDRLRKRKIFIVLPCLISAVSTVIPAVFPTWEGVLVMHGGIGLSLGMYFGVETAAISTVIADGDGNARDMGLMAIAVDLPPALTAGVAGAVVVSIGEASFVAYQAMFVVCAVICLAGAVCGALVRKLP